MITIITTFLNLFFRQLSNYIVVTFFEEGASSVFIVCHSFYFLFKYWYLFPSKDCFYLVLSGWRVPWLQLRLFFFEIVSKPIHPLLTIFFYLLDL